MSMSWGSKPMSDGSTYYGPLSWAEYMDAIYHPKEWLNSEWSKEKQTVFNDLYDFEFFGYSPFRDSFNKILDERNNDLYMQRYGVSYADVKDPRKLKSTSTMSIALGSVNFVSSNIKRLYKS